MTHEQYIVDYAGKMADNLEEHQMDDLSKPEVINSICNWLQGFLEQDGTIDSMKEGFCDNCDQRGSGERMINEGYL